MSECEIEKDGEYVGRYECATHGVWYCDSDTKPKESCPVGEAEEGLRREVERLTKMLEVCSVVHSHNVELKTERDAQAAEVQRLRRHYETCAHCQVDMEELFTAEEPRLCINCVNTQDGP